MTSGDITKIGQGKEMANLYDQNVEFFEDKILNLNDIPVPFFWTSLRKHSKHPITEELIARWSAKSTKNLKSAFSYLAGTAMIMVG